MERKNMNRKWRFFCLWLIVVFLLSGCRKENIISESDSLYTSKEISNDEAKSPDGFMELEEYVREVFADYYEENKYTCGFFADSSYIYSMDAYYTCKQVDGKTIYIPDVYLNKLSIPDKAISSTNYKEYDKGTLLFPYVSLGRVFAVSQINNEEGDISEYCIVEFFSDGSIKRMSNMSQILKERQWLPEKNFICETKMLYEPASECTYILSPKSDCLIVVDENSELLREFVGYEGNGKSKITDFTESSDGHILFMCEENGKETVFYFENGMPVTVYFGEKGEEAISVQRIVDCDGNIVFSTGSSILRWNLNSGSREKLCSVIGESDYSRGLDCFAYDDDGRLYILENNNLKVFSQNGPAKTVEIVIKPQQFLPYEVKQYIVLYEASHPGVSFKILDETLWENRDIELNKLYAKIADGGGPDLIFISDEQLPSLAKEGILYDLSGVLKNDIAEKLFPAVLNNGYIDGKKYVMSWDPEIKMFFINKKYCDKGEWSFTNIMNIVEGKEKEGNPFKQLIVGHLYWGNPFDVLSINICESEFVDLVNYSCNFESEEFIRFLNMCKRYEIAEEESAMSEDAGICLMHNDEALIYLPTMSGFAHFSNIYSSLGEEEYRTIGYPSTKGNGFKMTFYYGFAVNDNSMESDPDKRTVIEDFLNGLYIPDNIVKSGALVSSTPTRIDLLEGRIIQREGKLAIRLDDYTCTPIEGKKDGTSFEDEYLSLLFNCDNLFLGKVNEETIRMILLEETEAFFNGEKSAEETAKIIQARVKLYLMEIQ